MDEKLTASAELDDDAAEAQAIAEAQAGYDGKARAQAPAPEVKPAEQPLPDTASASASEEEPEPETDVQADPALSETVQLKSQLDDLKAQVRRLESNGADKETVRKMHGEIGEINRYVKQLATASHKDAPAAEDRLAAALQRAEATAAEFPEIGGPFLDALKELTSRLPAAAEPEQDTQTEATKEEEGDPVATPDQRAEMEREMQERIAIKSLDEVHPDRHTIKETKDFKDWFAAKPAEYQSKVKTSWNPAVVSQCFTDYKATVAARKRKQERLEAAATPQGLSRSTPSAISDEEAARIGYERARGKRL